MSDFPKVVDIVKGIVSPMSTNSIRSGTPTLTNSVAIAWPSANLAIYVPFRVADTTTFVKIFWLNGATIAGNVDVGIYDSEGNRLVSSGSIAHAGASVLQTIDITDTTLQPGLYYMAMSSDSTTATIQAVNALAIQLRLAGVYSQASAFPLPATATFTGTASNPAPILLLTRNTLI